MQVISKQYWKDYISLPEERWSLIEAAFLVSDQLQEQSNSHSTRLKWQVMCDELKLKISADAPDSIRLQLLNDYFFNELGFHGNSSDFFAEENNFLDRVLERRLGIPITLSILYMYLAQTIGLDVRAINFPGHFLVKVVAKDFTQILDPFNQAQVLNNDELEDLLTKHKIIVQDQSEIGHYLVEATKRDILIRLLRNLKNIYIEQRETEKALLSIELILSIGSDTIDEIRDRGMIYHYLEYTAGALKDLSYYLKYKKDSDEYEIIQSLIETLDEQTTILH